MAATVAAVLLAGAAVAVTKGDPVATVDAEGVVATLAGPGHCPQTAHPIGGSRATRALAVDADGRAFYETGPPDQPVIAVVGPAGEVDTLVSGIPQPPSPSGTRQTPAGAGRIVGDGGGGVFLAAGTQIVHIARDSSRTTVAGDPTADLGAVGSKRSGDGGPAADARFRSATSLARDAAGNLYVADHGGPALATSTIRFVNRSDEPVTFYRDTPAEVTVDPNHIDTIAGADPPADADGEANADDEPTPGEGARPARSAPFRGNTTLAVEGDRLYAASAVDESDPQAQISMVNLGGAPVTAHGHTVPPGQLATVTGGADPAAKLDSAAAIAVDGDNLYVADPVRHRVHHLDVEGFLATFAGAEGLGAEVGGFNGNRRLAVGARLNRPFDVAVGADGQVYVSDRRNGQVRIIDPATEVIRAVPGSAVALTWRCHRPNEAADEGEQAHQVGGPAAVVVDPDGTSYFALAEGNQVKRRDPSGAITTLAGTDGPGCELGCPGFSGDGEPARAAQLDTPTDVALGPENNLYILDGGNARVRFVNLDDEPVTVHGVTVESGHIATVAGGEDGETASVQLAPIGVPFGGSLVHIGAQASDGVYYRPQLNFGAITVDSQRNLFIAEPTPRTDDGKRADNEPTGRVLQVRADGTATTIAGAGTTGTTGECCRDPAGLAVDAADNLYISDVATYQVWLHNRNEQTVEAHGQTVAPNAIVAIAGTGTSGFAGHGGQAIDAQLLSPAGLAVADSGAVYLAEFSPRTSFVRKIGSDDSIGVLAGAGQSGFNGDAFDPRLSRLNLPADLAVDPCGNVLVADGGNDRLRRVNLADDCATTANAGTPNRSDGAGVSRLIVGLGVLVAAGAAVVGWWWRHQRV